MSNENNLDKEILRRLFSDIRLEEGKNLKTGKISDDQMIRYIEHKIKNAVNKEGE